MTCLGGVPAGLCVCLIMTSRPQKQGDLGPILCVATDKKRLLLKIFSNCMYLFVYIFLLRVWLENTII
jgi:hypothetical protein